MKRSRHLSRRSEEILRGVIAAIRPRGHGFDHAVDEDVLVEIDRTMPYLPAPLRLGFPIGLRLLEWSAMLRFRRRVRFSHLPFEDARSHCASWLHSRSPVKRPLLLGLRALVMLAFYQHPDVIRTMDVRWQERMEETIRLRADTLGTDHGALG